MPSQCLIALAHRMVQHVAGTTGTMSDDDAFWFDYCDRAADVYCLMIVHGAA